MTDTDPDLPHVALAITALHGVSGGAERVLVDVANGLHRRGYPVTVLTYQQRNGPTFYPLDFGIRRLDGRKRHARGRSGPRFSTLSSVTERRRSVAIALWVVQHAPKAWNLRRLLRIARPDVVIGFLPSTFTELAVGATGTRVPMVASLHNVPDRDLGGDPLRWDQNPVDIALRKRALRTSAANTVLLPSFLDQLEPDVRAKTYVIPNLIHPYDGPPADVHDADDNVVLAVGRLSPAKDHSTLLDAWAQIEADHPTWRLRIIGDGPLRGDLAEQIERLGLERAEIDEPTSEIERAYTSAKLLAMPSLHEGFGLVTAEALACGLPVVGFADCEGTNEIVLPGRNGLLVEPGGDRATAFAVALRTLMTDEAERVRLAEQAPATIEAFRPDRVIHQWERLVHDVHRREVGR